MQWNLKNNALQKQMCVIIMSKTVGRRLAPSEDCRVDGNADIERGGGRKFGRLVSWGGSRAGLQGRA